jgi:hypothetical protein
MKAVCVLLPPVACLLCGIVLAGGPLNISEYAERSRQERPAAIAETKRQLAQVRKTRRLKGPEKEREIQHVEALVADLENPLKPYFGSANFSVKNAKVGDVGHVREDLRVDRIIDHDTIAVVTSTATVRGVPSTDIRTAQSLGGFSYANEWVTISGISTVGMKEDTDVLIDALLVRTADGFEPADLSRFADMFTRKDERRTWTSSAGHHAQAILVSSEGGKVMLMDLDSKTTEIELSKLSEDDRDYVRKFKSEQSRLAKRRK